MLISHEQEHWCYNNGRVWGFGQQISRLTEYSFGRKYVYLQSQSKRCALTSSNSFFPLYSQLFLPACPSPLPPPISTIFSEIKKVIFSPWSSISFLNSPTGLFTHLYQAFHFLSIWLIPPRCLSSFLDTADPQGWEATSCRKIWWFWRQEINSEVQAEGEKGFSMYLTLGWFFGVFEDLMQMRGSDEKTDESW